MVRGVSGEHALAHGGRLDEGAAEGDGILPEGGSCERLALRVSISIFKTNYTRPIPEL